MRIAVIGAGFSGLAVAWHLLNLSAQVTVFDSTGIGGGASGIAVGLLHPYAGLHAKLNRFGLEGYAATLKLLEVASQALGHPVADFSGLLRIALNDSQKQDYADCAKKYPDVEWLNEQQCQTKIPGVALHPGIFIKSAVTVNCEEYLKGLWLACEQLGAKLTLNTINNFDELQSFDTIIATTGASPLLFPHLPITAVKGQVLELTPPKNTPLPKIPINTQVYLVQCPSKKTYLAGSTFERNFSSPNSDPSFAISEIMPKVSALFPPFENASIASCRAGIRASTPSHLPIIAKISPKCWALTGMGSKGLLYHALYAKMLAEKLM